MGLSLSRYVCLISDTPCILFCILTLKKASNISNIQKMFVREAYKPSSVIGGHLSRPTVTNGFKRNPESLTGRLKRSFVSCCGWGLHRGRVARPRVSSYLTFPPLHMPEGICGISLLHFPWGRPRRALPGILPCAARTFLTPFGARPPGNLTNAGIIAHSRIFVNGGNVWGLHPHTPARGISSPEPPSSLRGGFKQYGILDGILL